jgi:uncharacterized surface protein with fasciclin (FAS1) repeats
MTSSTLRTLALAAAVFAAPAVASAQGGPAAKPTKDIVGVAIEAGSFKTLVAALQAAGLVETLQGKGPFTVFAPTDAAFAKLPKGTVEALLADKEQLAAILTYHVVPGKVTAADVMKMGKGNPATVNGQTLAISVSGGKVYVNNATVVSADVMATNGVIHVIDTVVLPKKAESPEQR